MLQARKPEQARDALRAATEAFTAAGDVLRGATCAHDLAIALHELGELDAARGPSRACPRGVPRRPPQPRRRRHRLQPRCRPPRPGPARRRDRALRHRPRHLRRPGGAGARRGVRPEHRGRPARRRPPRRSPGPARGGPGGVRVGGGRPDGRPLRLQPGPGAERARGSSRGPSTSRRKPRPPASGPRLLLRTKRLSPSAIGSMTPSTRSSPAAWSLNARIATVFSSSAAGSTTRPLQSTLSTSSTPFGRSRGTSSSK